MTDAKRNKSKKREAIYEALSGLEIHPNAEMLYELLKVDYPELSLGTVYRNLSVLEEEGRIKTVAHVDGRERYDARTEPHAHFVCRMCGQVSDLDLPDTLKRLCRGIERDRGCTVENHAMVFTGLCRECKNKAFCCDKKQ